MLDMSLFQLPDLSCLSPASATEIGKVFMTSETIGWRDEMSSWLSSRSHDQADALEALFDKYIPQVIDFLRPVVATSGADTMESVSMITVSDRLSRNQIEEQDLRLSEVHLIKTCCQILEVKLIFK